MMSGASLPGRSWNMTAVQRHDCGGGMQAVDPHETGDRPLKAREAIVIDIFPQHLAHGYWGDLTRYRGEGTAPASLRTMYQRSKRRRPPR